MLALAASLAALTAQESCLGMFEQRRRAVTVEGHVVAAHERSVRSREDDHDVTRIVEDLDVRAPWQGRELRRTVTEGVPAYGPDRRNRVGETRFVLVDPEDPDATVTGLPAFFLLLPAVFAAGFAAGGLLLVVGARRKVAR